MTSHNPLHHDYDDNSDLGLLQQALEGNKKALNALVEKHSSFIYNIAIKMMGSVPDAEDITQDILIKVITNLSSYDPKKSQLRTWMYRIAFNHILNVKKSATETKITSFENFFGFMDQVEDAKYPGDENNEKDPLSEELKIKCMTGMLLCLPREDRLLYIVGDLFSLDHTIGSELFGISKPNYRKRLSRVRKDLSEWMHNRCGLVNHKNPCRCKKKTKGFIERGIVDPDNLIWDHGYQHKISTYVEGHIQPTLIEVDQIYTRLYQDHPLKELPESERIIDHIIESKYIKRVIDY